MPPRESPEPSAPGPSGGLTAWARRVRARLATLAPNESQHLFGLTLLVGVVCGFVAVAFHLSIRAAEHLLIDRALHASALRREHVELAVVIDRETGAPHGVVTRTAVARAFLEWHTGRHRASQATRERGARQESER